MEGEKGKKFNERVWLQHTCGRIVTGLMQFSHKQLYSNYGKNDDNENNKKSDVKQRHHRLYYWIQNYL